MSAWGFISRWGDAFYCTMQGEVPLNQIFLDQVKAYMKEMAEKALPIEKYAVATYEAHKEIQGIQNVR